LPIRTVEVKMPQMSGNLAGSERIITINSAPQTRKKNRGEFLGWGEFKGENSLREPHITRMQKLRKKRGE
jgi:hypothetical protein